MLDIRLIRERTEEVKARLGARGLNIDWDLLLKLDQERRDLLNAVEELRAQRRTASDQIAKLKRDKKPAEPLVEEMKSVGDRIAALEDELRSCEADLNNIALSIPNLPHESVPIGVDASANVEVRRWGKPPAFSFPAKPHWELGEALGILDFKRFHGRVAGVIAAKSHQVA